VSGRLISIIGPPAVGKTTLAENLARELPGRLIREDYAGNPFLAPSYVGPAEARLPSQLYFLLSRVAQLWPGASDWDALAISDYGFCQDAVYARLRLGEAGLALYRRVLEGLRSLPRRPDVLVHLDAAESTLLERIARRGRDHEQVMTEAFLARMRSAYDQAAPQQGCPVIRLDCDAEDPFRPDIRRRVIRQIREVLG